MLLSNEQFKAKFNGNIRVEKLFSPRAELFVPLYRNFFIDKNKNGTISFTIWIYSTPLFLPYLYSCTELHIDKIIELKTLLEGTNW